MFTFGMECIAKVSVKSNSKIIVHDKDLRVVLALLRVRRHDAPVRRLGLAEGSKQESNGYTLVRGMETSFTTMHFVLQNQITVHCTSQI